MSVEDAIGIANNKMILDLCRSYNTLHRMYHNSNNKIRLDAISDVLKTKQYIDCIVKSHEKVVEIKKTKETKESVYLLSHEKGYIPPAYRWYHKLFNIVPDPHPDSVKTFYVESSILKNKWELDFKLVLEITLRLIEEMRRQNNRGFQLIVIPEYV